MKNSIGRPSAYKPKFCQMLIDHMKQGYSFESFAGVVAVSRVTIYSWLKKYDEFREAKEVALSLNRLFWEQIGIDAVKGQVPGFNATAYVFNMRNRFNWSDRSQEAFKPMVIELPNAGKTLSIENKPEVELYKEEING